MAPEILTETFPHKESNYNLRNSTTHCVKSVRIQSYSGPHFSAFGLTTERYRVSLRIQSECVKLRTRITPNTDTFYAVTLQSRSIKIIMYGSETISSLGPKIWDILLTDLKSILYPTLLNKKICECAPKNCPCRSCKTYLQNIGFL